MNNEKEREIYKSIEQYFQNADPKARRPSSWRVPIGGSFYDAREVNAVLECFFRGWISVQKKVAEFENAFAEYVGAKWGVATNSGTSAITLTLATLLETGDLQRGDEVMVPATTFISDAMAVIQLGLIPVYVDVDPETFNINPEEMEKAIDPKKTKAALVVHNLGYPSDMDAVMDIAKRYNIKIIEDCCEAHGARYKGKKVGQFGDFAVFSFYVAHNITTGEGGMILTNSDRYHAIVAELREFGRLKSYQGPRYGYSDGQLAEFDERYTFHRLGYNFRMADTPAAFGIEQLKRLDELNSRRTQYARYYWEHLQSLDDTLAFPISLDDPNIVHAFYGFPIAIKPEAALRRSEFANFLESKGIETRAILCGTLPDQPSLRRAPGRTAGDLPVSRWIRDNAFFIGCHPNLSPEDVQHAVHTITEYCSR